MKEQWTTQTIGALRAKVRHSLVGGPFGSNLVSADYTEEGVPVIRGCNLPDEAPFSFDELVFVSEAKADALTPNNASPGDLVFTQRGTLGQVGLIPQDSKYPRFIISQSQMKLTVDPEKANAAYLYYYFRLPSTVERINGLAISSGVPHINLDILRNFQVITPPVTIQKRIARVLLAYDDLIHNNRRRIALLERLAKEMYREWFVRLRFPGHQGVKVVRGVPSGWEVRALSTFASEVKKGIKKRDIPDDEKYIGLEHIPRRSIAIREWATADTVDSNKLLFKERDILFSKIRPYLHKVALAHFSGACSSDTIVIRPKEKIYEGYLLFTVFSDTFIDLATVASKGTKMPRADWEFLKNLELTVPSEKLLQRYQEQFESLFSQIVNLLHANELLVSCRNRLLPRLIAGRLSVEELDIKSPPGVTAELEAEPRLTAHA